MVCWFHGGASVLLYFLLDVLVLRSLAEQQGPEVVIQTTELPCRAATDSFSCYHCKTNTHQEDDFCGDPFNHTHHQLDVVQCEKQDYCTKWVVQLKSGAIQTTRTCSNKMQLKLKIYTVCMTESGSNDGHLCFCEGELCNAATSLTPLTSYRIYLIVCAAAWLAGTALGRKGFL